MDVFQVLSLVSWNGRYNFSQAEQLCQAEVPKELWTGRWRGWEPVGGGRTKMQEEEQKISEATRGGHLGLPWQVSHQG